jgi:hypothetical protein
VRGWLQANPGSLAQSPEQMARAWQVIPDVVDGDELAYLDAHPGKS